MKVFQKHVNELRDILDREFGVLDDRGVIVACSDENRIGSVHPDFERAGRADGRLYIGGGMAFMKLQDRGTDGYTVYIGSADEESIRYLKLVAVTISTVRAYQEEKSTRKHFYMELLFGKTAPGETAEKARELKIPWDAPRAVMVVRAGGAKDFGIIDIIQALYYSKTRDCVIAADDTDTAVIWELKRSENIEAVEKAAALISDTLTAELMIKAKIGISTVANALLDLPRLYGEANTALEIGRIFEPERTILSYRSLGIGRLIYGLPEETCSLFLKEVLGEASLDSLEPEYLHTVLRFFESNLNVSETSRRMYIHRNTLAYRLEKIKKLTGLDLTRFDDAVVFKLAVQVKTYLERK